MTSLGAIVLWRIWNAASREFPGCTRVLDIYHGAEHIADAARTRFGEGTTTAKEWLDRRRGLLLSDGWAGLCDHLGQTMTTDDAPEDRAPLDDLMGYFATHTDRLNYCHRLYTGQSIGSGMVEGTQRTWSVDDSSRQGLGGRSTTSTEWPSYVV